LFLEFLFLFEFFLLSSLFVLLTDYVFRDGSGFLDLGRRRWLGLRFGLRLGFRFHGLGSLDFGLRLSRSRGRIPELCVDHVFALRIPLEHDKKTEEKAHVHQDRQHERKTPRANIGLALVRSVIRDGSLFGHLLFNL
jgi:hypothetical protein